MHKSLAVERCFHRFIIMNLIQTTDFTLSQEHYDTLKFQEVIRNVLKLKKTRRSLETLLFIVGNYEQLGMGNSDTYQNSDRSWDFLLAIFFFYKLGAMFLT